MIYIVKADRYGYRKVNKQFPTFERACAYARALAKSGQCFNIGIYHIKGE